MNLRLPVSSPCDRPIIFSNSDFLQPSWKPNASRRLFFISKKPKTYLMSITCSSPKLVHDRSLDKHVEKANKIRFVQKLRTLLLSKPKHYMHLHNLSKCRSYLSLQKPRSIISMIHRYPTIFELFRVPTPPTPLNATKPLSQLCVRLTPAAEALATQELNLKSAMSVSLANKLQKLLMLSSHGRLLLSKLVHLGPDLGLPPNFRSHLCNNHPNRFKTVDTSYGRALELVSWDLHLANPLPPPKDKSRGLIVERPLKFKLLRLRKGLNVKRHHQDFLLKFGELPDVCPYKTKLAEVAKESIKAEKRACAVVREVLGMMVEKRTLIDHLTHFRKEFGLPNKLRGMLLRHPELFYVSLKGQRDSVFLVEAYDDNGKILEKDDMLVIKDQLIKLLNEGKKIRRDRKKAELYGEVDNFDEVNDCDDEVGSSYDADSLYGDYDDDLDNLFESDDSSCEDDDNEHTESALQLEEVKFWSSGTASVPCSKGDSEVLSLPW